VADTVREQALAAFFAALQAITGVYNLRVERNRDTEVTKFPTLVQIDGPQRAEHAFTGSVLYTATVRVEAYVQANETGLTTAQMLDQLYGKVVQALAADPTLGGKAVDVTERDLDTDTDRAPGHAPGGALLCAFDVMYETAEGDPFTRA
jgi:hypothetical protein